MGNGSVTRIIFETRSNEAEVTGSISLFSPLLEKMTLMWITHFDSVRLSATLGYIKRLPLTFLNVLFQSHSRQPSSSFPFLGLGFSVANPKSNEYSRKIVERQVLLTDGPSPW